MTIRRPAGRSDFTRSSLDEPPGPTYVGACREILLNRERWRSAMASPLSLFMPVIPGTDLQNMAQDLAQFQTALGAARQAIGTVHYTRTLSLAGAVRQRQSGLGSK